MLNRTVHIIWRIEEMMQALGLIGTILIACTIGILLGAASIDLDRLARMTAMLSWLTLIAFGTRAVYQHKLPAVTAIVGIGIAQGILYFMTDTDTSVLSIMCDVMSIATVIYLTKKRK